MKRLSICLLLLTFCAPLNAARLKDLAGIEGVRENVLMGYGLIVGLNGTGDRQQTVFSTQSLSNLLRKMGVNVAPNALRVANVAAVMVTATLPPFATPGTKLDVTVSSMGDSASLQGGTLLLTSLKAANGNVYAVAQGPVSIGGYSAGQAGAGVQVNHPTVGRVPEGAHVELAAPTVQPNASGFKLQLRKPDFATASRVAKRITEAYPDAKVEAQNSGVIAIVMPPAYEGRSVDFIAELGALEVTPDRRARVVLNERTGTVVIGSDVSIAPVAVLHGSLTVQVVTDYLVSQPNPFASGDTTVVPQTTLQVDEQAAREVSIKEGASVEDLIRGLMAIGSTPRDIIAIMQSISAAGALHAELEVM
jgi:flagellar P-ring protein precursor FlgI